ncbi:SNF2 family N-terminal domain-containing protein [Ilyonectria robusta]|uniref:SNF2 family N-terminal domain-containing protein n=1 Tax=Ilyonectria robusta TaxID=1079257 RepID=UPI001E8CBA19|nr:SNF2 family N-terminal domain-containing protein [Ilyonectria robusta]KAH8688376.1 SNF2 family N-terminal domain-containing protein [Ilyonectria robusta]
MKPLKRKLPPHDENPTRLLQPLTPRHKRPSPLLAVRRSAEVVTTSSPATPSEVPSSPERDPYELGEVLFGILKDIQVLLKWEPKSTDEPTKIPAKIVHTGENVREFTLDFSAEHCLVRLNTGGAVGVLEARALNALGALVEDTSPVRFEASMPESEWQDIASSMANHIRKAKPITIQIDVIGPRYKAEVVSRTLGVAKLFLQSPAGWGVLPYENPQCLNLPLPVSRKNFHDGNGILHLHQDNKQGGCDSDGQDDTNEETISLDPVKILNGINQYEFSGLVDIDSRITTELHLYQKKGVEFISRRESGQSLPNQTLWEPLNPEQNTIGYRHAITGAKSRTEEDSPGGILADDMGLGKTLMMIAAILGSKDRAQEYMSQNDAGPVHDLKHQHRPIIPTKSTLIVVLSELLLANWVKQIESHTSWGTIKYYKYHGRERTDDPSLFGKYDIVLTTYGTVAADFRKRRGTLNSARWYRTVLDEAHTIRNWSTKQFSAVNDIPAHIRWCMTGTPIQNGLEDLGSLVRFLRVPVLEDIGTFRRHICAGPGSTRTLKQNLPNLHLLLRSICLQRTQDLLGLRSTTKIFRLDFLENERSEYLAMEAVCRTAIDMAVNSKASHQNVLEKLLRLREFCNGITAITSDGPDALFSIMEQSGEIRCAYCTAEITSPDAVDGRLVQLTECGRFICTDISCTLAYQTETESVCLVCKVPHRKFNLLTSSEDPIPVRESPRSYPSKLLHLLDDVKLHMGQEKCIVFSVWKRTLNLVEALFTENGIKYCRVDGSISTTTRRKKILLDFQEQDDIRVLLMTLGTGAVGLNDLSVASRVHLIEPQWNPSVERQAIGRVIRLGQEREVNILRYIMKGSIEELVEKRQIQKLQLASGGFNLSQLAKDMDAL